MRHIKERIVPLQQFRTMKNYTGEQPHVVDKVREGVGPEEGDEQGRSNRHGYDTPPNPTVHQERNCQSQE